MNLRGSGAIAKRIEERRAKERGRPRLRVHARTCQLQTPELHLQRTTQTRRSTLLFEFDEFAHNSRGLFFEAHILILLLLSVVQA